MATKLSPPPRRTVKGEPPAIEEIKSNLKKPEPSKKVALNFRVPASFKRDFKIASATHGITQSELLIQAFELWSKHN